MARALLFCGLVCSGVAGAQALPAFALERFHLDDGQAEGLSVATGDGVEARHARVALGFQVEKDPLVLRADGVRQGAVVDTRVTAHLVAAFGVFSWLQVAGELPVVVSQQGADFRALGVSPVAPAGLGSPWLSVRARLLTQAGGGLMQEHGPADLAVGLSGALPVGSGAALALEPGGALAPQLSLGRTLGALRVGGEASVVVRQASVLSGTVDGVTMKVGSQALVGVAVSTRVSGLLLEAAGRVAVSLDEGLTPPGIDFLFGARGPVGPVEFFVVGGPGFGRLPGTPAFRVLGGVALSWPQPRAGSASE